MAKKSKEVGTLGLVMSKLGITSKDMQSLLNVTRQTVYNYRNSSDEQLPKVVKEKLIKAFNQPNIDKLREYIECAKKDTKTYKEAKTQLKDYLSGNNISNFDDGDIEKETQCINPKLNISEAYKTLLNELLTDILSKGNDYELLNILDNYKKTRGK